MHPVFIQFKVPVWFTSYFGPGSFIFSIWKFLAVALIACFFYFLWAEEPTEEKDNTRWIQLSGILSLLLGIVLAGVLLVKLGEVNLHTYGVMMSMGFLVAIVLASREAKKQGESPEKILDLAFWILISGVVGSRVLDMVVSWRDYFSEPEKLWRVWEGGLVFYGGLIGAALATIWFVRVHKLNFWKTVDIAAPSLVIGQFFGRLGCFAAGCCHGKKSDLFWSVRFPQGPIVPPQLASMHVHPTQLYEATGHILLFFALLWTRSKKRFHGHVFAMYLLLYPIVRFTVELFRGDKSRGFYGELDIIPLEWAQSLKGSIPAGLQSFLERVAVNTPGPDLLTTSQIVSLVLFSIGLVVFFTLGRRQPLLPAPASQEAAESSTTSETEEAQTA
mgnify:CR=1 FL=1